MKLSCAHREIGKSQKHPNQTNGIIIDVMALVGKIQLKKLDSPVKTFNDFAIALTYMRMHTERTASRMKRGREEGSQNNWLFWM